MIDPDMSTGTPSPGTQLVADTFRQQFGAAGGGGTSPVAERFVQTLLDNTGLDEGSVIAAVGGTGAQRGRGGGGGSKAKARAIQVTVRFMTRIDRRFREGDVQVAVYDGRGERFLWKTGAGDPYVRAVGTDVTSPKLSASKDSVTVEMRVRMFKEDHDVFPNIPILFFGTAKVYDIPHDGKLRVIVDVDQQPQDWTVDAPDADSAFAKIFAALPPAEAHHHIRGDSKEIAPGRFRVTTWHWTKRLLARTPASIGEIY